MKFLLAASTMLFATASMADVVMMDEVLVMPAPSITLSFDDEGNQEARAEVFLFSKALSDNLFFDISAVARIDEGSAVGVNTVVSGYIGESFTIGVGFESTIEFNGKNSIESNTYTGLIYDMSDRLAFMAEMGKLGSSSYAELSAGYDLNGSSGFFLTVGRDEEDGEYQQAGFQFWF